MGAKGFVFVLLILPVIYVILLLTNLLVLVYDPFVRIGLILLVSLLYLLYSFRKKYSRRKNDYFEDLSLQSNKIGDKEYFFTIQHNQKAHVTTISTYIEGIYGYDFSLKFEGKIERFFKSIGLSSECQSGDTRFDETVYIVSDDEWLCGQMKSIPELRKLFYDLFWCFHDRNIKVKSLQCFDGRILVVALHTSKEENETLIREFARAAASLLHESLAYLPSKGSIDDTIYRESTGYAAHIFHVVILALLANGAIVFFSDMTTVQIMPHMVHSFSIVPLSIASTFVVVALLLAAAFFFLYRSSRLSPVAIQIFSLGMLGIFLTSIVEIKEINSAWDTSATHMYQSQIVGKEAVHHRKRGTTYHLYFSPWNWQGSSFDLVVPYSMYVRSNEGDLARIYTHPGYLHYPWIENIEITPNVPNDTETQKDSTPTYEKEAFWDDMTRRENNSTD